MDAENARKASLAVNIKDENLRLDRKVRLSLAFLISTILLFANTVFEWPFAIRFLYSPLNYLSAGLLALSIPVSIIYIGRTFVHRLWRYFTIVAGVVLLIPIVPFSVLSGLSLGGNDFQLQDSLASGLMTYRVYLNQSGSALTPPLTVLRKERDTVFGIKFVRTIWSDPHYGKATLRSINNSTLEVDIDKGFFKTTVDIYNSEKTAINTKQK